MSIDSFEDRYKYLKLDGVVGEDTFGFDRWMNQKLYSSDDWRSIRNSVILRDNGCDLGIQNVKIFGRIYVHHMNPIRKEDILEHSDFVLNPEYLICCSKQTHDAIHFGDESLLVKDYVERRPNDTTLWRR